MAYNQCMRLLPVLGRRVASSPSTVGALRNPVRSIWTPWPHQPDIHSLMRDMERQMLRLERDMMRGFMPLLNPESSKLSINPSPRVKDGQYCVAVDLAGFKPEEIDISLDESGRKLTIQAKCERKGRDGSLHSQEMVRQIALPDGVDIAQLKSMMHIDGVLAIEAPFVEKAQQHLQEPQQIPIQRVGASGGAEGTQQQIEQQQQQA